MRWLGAQAPDTDQLAAPGPVEPSGAADRPAAAEARNEDRSVVLTDEGWLVGRIVHPLSRVSDALAATRFLRVSTEDGERQLDRDDVLLVAPPAIPAHPELRVPKRRYPVVVDVGPVRVHGQAHVMPGGTVWDAWQRSPSGFAPITEAVLDFPDGTSETAPVVLVSRHAASSGLATSPAEAGIADGRGRDGDWLEHPVPHSRTAAAEPSPWGHCPLCGSPREPGWRFCGGARCLREGRTGP